MKKEKHYIKKILIITGKMSHFQNTGLLFKNEKDALVFYQSTQRFILNVAFYHWFLHKKRMKIHLFDSNSVPCFQSLFHRLKSSSSVHIWSRLDSIFILHFLNVLPFSHKVDITTFQRHILSRDMLNLKRHCSCVLLSCVCWWWWKIHKNV